ncbi:hypothetical protein KUTeg_016962 [Tegillarca granosa]|uniref:Uncharacterized protein n=1 Tax=Tegillarca granosa TaxID=220873 RepID=A0ABQ9ES76_TEGGR|nr:hypothetical protein KUTeg_016962 [Tegillarca granosa]
MAMFTPSIDYKEGPMSYVVGRGCTYLTDNYFRFQLSDSAPPTSSSATSAPVNWVTWMYDTCVKNYVPLELVHALINCGKTNALYALNPPQWILDTLHPDFSTIPGVVGKHYTEEMVQCLLPHMLHTL